ncbi:unnamed protein product [Hydatigera taeniaeformis]|uniref:Ovule protein n=1 Tax=Hydatigena taeniaeformis TaxID=6205 RepID=A0A0R3WX88_HYDTA|nr:unnamed protein product [Hydatigera taeniaeformis]
MLFLSGFFDAGINLIRSAYFAVRWSSLYGYVLAPYPNIYLQDFSIRPVDVCETVEAAEKFVDVSSRGSVREKTEGDKRLGSSSSLGPDPMTLECIKVLQEQRLAPESEVNPVGSAVKENRDPETIKVGASFGDFLLSRQFDYDSSSTEQKPGEISIGGLIDEKR